MYIVFAVHYRPGLVLRLFLLSRCTGSCIVRPVSDRRHSPSVYTFLVPTIDAGDVQISLIFAIHPFFDPEISCSESCCLNFKPRNIALPFHLHPPSSPHSLSLSVRPLTPELACQNYLIECLDCCAQHGWGYQPLPVSGRITHSKPR